MTKASVIIAICFVVLFQGCKKNGDDDKNQPKKLDQLFVEQTWSGELKYKAKSFSEPYAIFFAANNTFGWTDVSGFHTGTYTLNETDRKVTLAFNNGSVVILSVPGNDTITSAAYGAVYPWSIVHGEYNSSSSELLVGTKWKTNAGVTMEFLSATAAKFGSISTMNYTQSGAFVRVYATGGSIDIYLTFNKNKMKGVIYSLGFQPSNPEFTRQ